MATIEQFQGRLRLAVREALQKVLADGDLPEAEEGEARFTTIETLALAAGAQPAQAADLANRASGIAVGKLGTATVTAAELAASFSSP